MSKADKCCASGVLDVHGSCCPAGSVLDSSGACCEAGWVDRCGTCGGSSWTVDIMVRRAAGIKAWQEVQGLQSTGLPFLAAKML